MIIDVHMHPTDHVDAAWRHGGRPFTGERMLKMMDGPYIVNGKPRRVDIGVIQPPPGNTVWREGMRTGREGIRDYMAHCTSMVQKYPDRFIGNFTFNPRFGVENGVAELEFHVKEYGYKMMKLHSNMHAYRPDRALDWIRPAVKKCAELGIPRAFALTYQVAFFEKLGFRQIAKEELPHKIWSHCLNCPKFPDCDEVAVAIEVKV